MSKKSALSRILISIMVFLFSGSFAQAQERITVTWFIGMGNGTSDQQIAVENEVANDFNASQNEIELVINVSPDARSTLGSLIAGGNPPDIVGPMGIGASNAFADQWWDLNDITIAQNSPLKKPTAFTVSNIRATCPNPSFLCFAYPIPEGRGLNPSIMPPMAEFAIYPSLTYYNRSLFDRVGLNYPPQQFGAPYIMPDGTAVDWNYDTAGQIARLLTLDANGNDATSPNFDFNNIVQFGLNFQWETLRLIWSNFQPEQLYDWNSGSVNFPEAWRGATYWLHDGMWGSHFIPNNSYSEQYGGNLFDSGQLAMAIAPLWYTCCIGDSVGNFQWDIATVPMSLDGQYHVAADADTFGVLKGSAHPQAAVMALNYLFTDGAAKLAPAYGAFPTNPDYQQAWFYTKDSQYNQGINWQLVTDSLAHLTPLEYHHEANFPNWQMGYDRTGQLFNTLAGDGGQGVNVDAELDNFINDLQSIVSQ